MRLEQCYGAMKIARSWASDRARHSQLKLELCGNHSRSRALFPFCCQKSSRSQLLSDFITRHTSGKASRKQDLPNASVRACNSILIQSSTETAAAPYRLGEFRTHDGEQEEVFDRGTCSARGTNYVQSFCVWSLYSLDSVFWKQPSCCSTAVQLAGV